MAHKLARGRKLYRRMNACWDAGGFVRVGTAARYTDLKAKNRELVKLGASGSVYMARGVLLNTERYSMSRFLLRSSPFRLNRKAKTRASRSTGCDRRTSGPNGWRYTFRPISKDFGRNVYRKHTDHH